MRIVYRFGKLGRLRYISHLDLQRFMQRALRRTNLPVAYSQGFNPHPLLSFASALAMGWSSEYELFDLKLSGAVEAGEALAQMRAALPPEMPVYECRLVPDEHPALMASLTHADYRIRLSGDSAPAIFAQVPRYLDEESVLALRKTKSGEKECDIRPMTESLTAADGALSARLALTERATLKPDLLVRVLAERAGIERADCAIHRVALLAKTAEGFVPLFDL